MKNKKCLQSAIWEQSLFDNKDLHESVVEMREIICSTPAFWDNVDLIEKLLSPLADAILKIEGSIVNVRGSYKAINDAFQKSLKISDQFEANEAEACKEVIISN